MKSVHDNKKQTSIVDAEGELNSPSVFSSSEKRLCEKANYQVNLANLSYSGLIQFFLTLKEPAFRAKQWVKWVHQEGVTDFDQMTNFSKHLREQLKTKACIQFPEIAYEKIASDGTIKWLVRLFDHNHIEMVFIPDKARGTLCVSSQVGCGLNCSFCSTGKQGFNRNLSLAEIIGQVFLARTRLVKLKANPLTNVVMMGMGEPLLNYDAVIAAMHFMMDDNAYGLSKYRVTLSTSGVLPAMQKLKTDSNAALAVSLHAPNDALRNQLVPINKKYPLAQLIPLCRDYFKGQKKRVVVFEYVMLADVNDQPEHARQLIQLLEKVPCKINLIPFNPFDKTRYTSSPMPRIIEFQNQLIRAGFTVHIRKTRGEDVDGACGQLAGQFTDRTGRHARWLKTGKLVPDSSASVE